MTNEDWDRNATFWTKIIREKRDRFREELTDPAVLAAVGPCSGKHILDAGCGEGYLSRELASLGATVVGVDSSERLIEAARQVPPLSDDRTRFVIGDFTDLTSWDPETFDIVVSNHSINEVADPASAFRGFARILVPKGLLVLLMLHPCFYRPPSRRTYEVHDATLPTEYFRIREIREPFQVDGLVSPAPAVRWLRPLESHFALIHQAGFRVTSVLEPHPEGTLANDPWWTENFSSPLFLLISAERDIP